MAASTSNPITHYDRDGDVLYVTLKATEDVVCMEPEDGLVLRIDPTTDQIVGITIVGFKARMSKRIKVADIVGSNPQIDESELRASIELCRALRRMGVKKRRTDSNRSERAAKARLLLSGITERASGDPATDPFAAKMQQLRARRRAGLPLYDAEILAEAMKVHDDLTPLRKAANQVVLGDE